MRALVLACLLFLGCATTDVKQAAKACGDVAVNAAAAEIAPAVAEAIGCMSSKGPDGGAPDPKACVEKSLGDMAKTVAPDVYACALAKIHDQTIP